MIDGEEGVVVGGGGFGGGRVGHSGVAGKKGGSLWFWRACVEETRLNRRVPKDC